MRKFLAGPHDFIAILKEEKLTSEARYELKVRLWFRFGLGCGKKECKMNGSQHKVLTEIEKRDCACVCLCGSY